MIFLPLPLAKTIKLCQRAESTLLLGHQRTLTGRATAVGQGGRCWMLWSSTGFEMGRMGRISLHLTHFLRISDANLWRISCELFHLVMLILALAPATGDRSSQSHCRLDSALWYTVSKQDFWCLFCLVFPRQIFVPCGPRFLRTPWFLGIDISIHSLFFEAARPCRMTLRPGWTGLEDRVMRSFGNQGLEISK